MIVGKTEDGYDVFEFSPGAFCVLTQCCSAAVTYSDTDLCCKSCWNLADPRLDRIVSARDIVLPAW